MSRGRPSKDPILPEKVNPEEDKKKDIRGQLYGPEWNILRKKIQERGYSSIAGWVEDKARDVLTDRDLRERKEELESKINSKKDDIEDLKEELEEIEEQLEGKEEQLEEVLEDIEEDLIELHDDHEKGMIPTAKVRKFVRRGPEKYGINWIDQERVKRILGQEVSNTIDERTGPGAFSKAVIERIQEEDLIEIKEGKLE